MPLYTNLDGTTPDKGPLDILRWQITDRLTGKRRREPSRPTPRRENDGAGLRALAPHATWIGHATWVFRLGGNLVATDPIWSDRIQAAVPRFAPPGVPLDRVPEIDVVTVSHAHYDHLDLPTLRRIGPRARYVVPRDNADILHGAGLRDVIELGWWESVDVGELRITLVPAQHWSMRLPWDRNRRLWGGFVFESREGCVYHAGDTAMREETFRDIGRRFPEIGWAMLPIGAYDPPWFMQPQHMGPEEAARAFELLGAERLLAMHWGTFRLTDEPLHEPPERLRAEWARRDLDRARLWILDLGETRPLG